MNKAQLVEAIADKMGGRQQAADAVDAVLDAIVRAVVAGDRVSVTGFGSFEKVDRPARYARNPQTGERVRVKKTSVPRFRAGQGFKDLVSGSKKLPKGGEVAVKKAPKGSLSGPPPTIAKAAGKKAATKKAAGARKTAAAATKKAAAKKTTATAKKAAAKKTTGTAKTAAAKKSTSAAKKTATKATAKKAPAKKATAKKAPARKSPARKTTTAKRASSARQ
ncbi:DNA-binding protein HU-beta [Streptomyces sp. B3I7]|uniref:HU family DNA-binding protein n=1 Tax=unclassified Streptomyces TaxID=2593676 RepID=UPI0027876503|nr:MULTISPECIES: HU family DNA-binding protein [unclassified Streptomyces]MDQ0789440.1 DNA-binding protein HU-beta [Streptomyces sp. B3I8]MDQ0810942.1 DNA-binding protein HU-beta [Streptomyces sp. B3I7]